MRWFVFALFVFIPLLGTLFFYKKDTLKTAIGWTFFWIALALCFNLYIYLTLGKKSALEFLTGYLVEKSLSFDNLFVFLLIFQFFQTPHKALHDVLFWGIAGALVLRGIFIFLGVAILEKFHFIFYLLGLLLIFLASKLFFQKKKEIHPEKNLIIRLFTKFFPVTETYVDNRFFVRRNRKLFATPLMIVLLAIETTDIIFAIDSVPAILGVTLDSFIVYSSNVFAILGLRSLFFVLSDIMIRFYYLHFGLALILVFIGIKMVISAFIDISIYITLGVVVAILAISIVLSLFAREKSD